MSLPAFIIDISGLPLPAPDACFFDMNGIAAQLTDPQYEQILIDIAAFISTFQYPLNLNDITGSRPVKWLSTGQQHEYNQQIALFRKVYAYNKCAYSTATASGTAPQYFKFITYKDYNNYQTSIGTINKLYPPVLMDLFFDIPFPPFSG
jgi:hypothetical protein